jgi:hypothetical protein
MLNASGSRTSSAPISPSTARGSHQITAVYGELLTRQPLRFLLADDPGPRKTMMAGLLIKELIIRGDLFYAKVALDPNRPTPQISNVAQSILSELDRVRGTRIALTLDIDAGTAEGVFPEDVESVVRDNAAALARRAGITKPVQPSAISPAEQHAATCNCRRIKTGDVC